MSKAIRSGREDRETKTTSAELQKARFQRMEKRLQALSPDEFAIHELAGEAVRTTLTAAPGNGQPFGGIKVITENGWFAARPSGTEDVYKIYAESFRSQAHLRQIQQEAQVAVTSAIGDRA